MKSSFTISLDFELRWGIRDNTGADQYEDAIMGGRNAIPKMLDLFEGFGVAVTWATVGFLFAENRDDLINHLPCNDVKYKDKNLSPYSDIKTRVGWDEVADPLHFGLSLIKRIQDTPGQEIGTHTFSHFYCLEEGGTVENFAADIRAAQAIAQARGIAVKSLVLPRNQVSEVHLTSLQGGGISTFRSNPRARFYAARPRGCETLGLRAARLADSVLPLTSTLATAGIHETCGLFDIPASRFLRPVDSDSSLIARAQRRRIKAEMTTAARNGKNYHLWWHPHNFGRSTDANLNHLRKLLKHFRILHDQYDMQSRTMFELFQSRM